MMSEQQFSERWQGLLAAESAELQGRLAEARARAEERLAAVAEKITDKVREAHSRDKARLIHEALSPDAHGRYLKQERLAELTGMDRTIVGDYDHFGQWLLYVDSDHIKPTLQTPLFFDRLTLSDFLRLLAQTESQVGGRSPEKVRREDYERRFGEMVEKVNAGAGQPVTREQVYRLLETLAAKKKPVPVASLVQALEQRHPERTVSAKDVNIAVGAFKKRNDHFTEVIETPQGPAVRVRKTQRVDPGKALASVEDALPLLEEILELSGRTTARTSLVQIAANAQRIIRALKELRAWAESEPQDRPS